MGDPKSGCWPPLTCPWNAEYAVDSFTSYPGDFQNGFCSLKYIKVCTKTLYESLYDQGIKVCKKNDAFTQFNLFVNELFAMGKNYEKVNIFAMRPFYTTFVPQIWEYVNFSVR